MTYNPKTFRKFVATAATATLVAGAIAPMALASANFSDVAPKYEDAVNFVVSHGINGYSETQFGTSDNIKRVDAAVMIAKVLGLDVENAPASGFTDVPERAVEYVNAIKEAGITNGKTTTSFDSESFITRGELAIWIQRGFELQSNDEIPFTDVDGTRYEEAVKALLANEITNGVSKTQFGVQAHAKRGDYAIFLYRADQAQEEFTSGLSGFILDGTTPVKDATVTVDGNTATTDENGYYELLNVAPGTQEVTIDADGYETVTVEKVEVLQEKVTSLTKDISAVLIDKTAIQVSGMIVDSATGAAIDGANVILEKYDAENDAWIKVADVDSVNGAYTVTQTEANPDLELGAEYRQTVTFADYHDLVQTITLDDQEVANVLAGIELDEIAAIDVTGTVTNAAGEKVASASVTIFNADGEQVGADTTDANGVYSVADAQVLSGTYNVVVDDTISAVSYTEFDVEEGTDVAHNVQLEVGNAITAKIGTESLNDAFGENGTDADTANYTLELLSGNTVIATQTVAGTAAADDATLDFSFSRIAPGSYTVKISGDYVVTEEFALNVDGDETLEQRAVPAGLITGTATDSVPAALVGATVNLLDADGDIVDTTETAADGTYKFAGVSAGDYTVEVVKADYVTEESAEFTVAKNGTIAVAALALEDVVTTGDVTGFVRVGGTLAPVSGATVVYYDKDGEEVYNTTVGATGSYSLTEVEAGTYEVVVRGAGVEAFSTIQEVKAGDDLKAVNYNLKDGGDASLKISVVDSKGNPVNISEDGIVLEDSKVDPTTPNFGVIASDNVATDTVTMTNLAAGTYNLSIDVESATFVDVDMTVTVAEGEAGELVIVVDEVASQSDVNFRIIDEANANVDGASVVVFNEDGSIKDVLTTTDGTAPLALIDGTYTLAVIQNGYVVSKTAVVVAGKDVNVPVIQLVPVKQN